MKMLGLDVGSKTIGVAVSDALGWTAQGLKTISWNEKKFGTASKQLQEIIEANNIEKIIVGLPKNMNGTIGERGEKSQQFAKKLNQAFKIPVDLWDERLTTMQAEKVLISADVSRAKRKKVIDKMAAMMILQNYLDSKN